MTNREAIEVLTNLIPISTISIRENGKSIHLMRVSALKMAIEALEQPKWIPCSERLPEEVGVYLVSMNRLGYPQREVDGFVCGRWERFGNDVIAWCKIPEPYKAENEK